MFDNSMFGIVFFLIVGAIVILILSHQSPILKSDGVINNISTDKDVY